MTRTNIPDHCLKGELAILLGDSHADAMFGSFARTFNGFGLELIYMGRGGCDPLHFTPSARKNNRNHGCANLLGPFERLLSMPTSIASVVVTPSWSSANTLEAWSEIISQFDRSRTRILILAPVPGFKYSSLDCVVLSDRYGISRDRCTRSQFEVEKDRAVIVDVLKKTADKGFGNVRYVDPIDIFCDERTCRPFKGNQVFYRDGSHVLAQGADLISQRFENDFRWLTWKE